MMYLGHICSISGELIDEVLVVVMRGPQSYTRQDVVEIHSHGGVLAARMILERILQQGARLADPGEFTKRAWLNGRIDLAQAEAVIDLIQARGSRGIGLAIKQLDGDLSTLAIEMRQQLKRLMVEIEAGIDFPEEISEREEIALKNDLRKLLTRIDQLIATARAGRIYREGLAIVLIGKPNSGKSTLLNRMLGRERALVTNIPGTTRDLIEETANIKGIPIRLIDTAGIREQAGIVETIGIERAKEALNNADLVFALFDATTRFDQADQMVADLLSAKQNIILLNKVDANEQKINREQLSFKLKGRAVLEISADLGWGMQDLEQSLVGLVGEANIEAAPAMLTRIRHQAVLEKARKTIKSALETMSEGGTLDCVAIDLWEAWSVLGEILGEAVSEEIINGIFNDFCIGK
jgi:tRNA modification GTPase